MSTAPKRRRTRRAATVEEPMQADTPSKRQCTASARTTGEQCTNPPINGGTVCRMHGGSSPQVKNAARRRLNALAEPAVVELEKILQHSGTTDKEKLRAIQLILDRTGHGPSANVKIDAAWESVLAEVTIVSGEDDEAPAWRKNRYAQPEDYEEDPED